MAHTESFDFIIIGAGIMGLTVARELANRRPRPRILILEKESAIGQHASGRNSGVIHAGIYYAADSMKARFSVDGHRRLIAFAEAKGIPLLKCGKVIVATKPANVATLETLMERAGRSGVKAERITLARLRELEPSAKSFDHALWSPETAVVDSGKVLEALAEELREKGVRIEFTEAALDFDIAGRTVYTEDREWRFEHLFNTAGTHADEIAHAFECGEDYRILPFKGLYWKAAPGFAKKIERLIYPAPDINMPFLGVHITRTTDSKVLFGPTAIPAFGRENYGLLSGLDLSETTKICYRLSKMLVKNPNHLRNYVREEIARYVPRNFFLEAQTLVQELKREDIGDFYKVGIRAQLMNVKTDRLEMDFLMEHGPNSTHVLNAVSPAFTGALALAPYIVSEARV